MPRKAAPLKQQTFRIVALGLGPLIGLVIGIVALNTSGAADELPPFVIPIMIAFVIILAAVGIGLGLLLGKKLVGDRIETAFRAPGEKWRHGRLEVHHGRVTLRRYWWQLRVPVGEPVELVVHELGPDTGRRPAARQWWTLNPQLSIQTLETDQGTYELAALPAHLEELRDRLQEPAEA
jgi:hypothetical protein